MSWQLSTLFPQNASAYSNGWLLNGRERWYWSPVAPLGRPHIFIMPSYTFRMFSHSNYLHYHRKMTNMTQLLFLPITTNLYIISVYQVLNINCFKMKRKLPNTKSCCWIIVDNIHIYINVFYSTNKVPRFFFQCIPSKYFIKTLYKNLFDEIHDWNQPNTEYIL